MSSVYEKLIRPLAFALPAETAHDLGIAAMRLGLSAPTARSLAGKLFSAGWDRPLTRFGLKFPNPVGVAAGFDKNGRVVDQLAALGFGSVEVGTVTYEPQPGNERPRLFRLPKDKALINRLGFNNDGAAAIARRLNGIERKCIVGVNIGRNKDIPNEGAIENYIACFETIHPVADYIAINVSSPNTPGLRDLQQAALLEKLISGLQGRNRELGKKPLLVKLAPDLDDEEIAAAVEVCMENEIAGIIATNTTMLRSGLKTKNPERFGSGGLSGRPLAERSNEVISKIYRRSEGKLPIIGVGGVFSAEDAFEKVRAGASLVQVYTGLVYCGPAIAREISTGLATLLEANGYESLDLAVGSGVGV